MRMCWIDQGLLTKGKFLEGKSTVAWEGKTIVSKILVDLYTF